MKKYLIPSLLLISLFFSACQEEKDPLQLEIEELEAKMAQWPSSEVASELIERYQAYAEAYESETDKAANALLQKAKYQFYLKRPAATVKTLKQALRQYPQSAVQYDILVMLAQVWQQKVEMQPAAQALYASLPEAFPRKAEAVKLRDSLVVEKKSVLEQLDSLKMALYNSQVRIDRAAAERFVNMAEAYALALPQSPQAPAYLFDAAKVAGYLGRFSRSIDLYTAVYEQYPEYEKAHQALFMLGFIYDSDLKDYKKARHYYSLYLEKYPEGAFADQIEMLIRHLGKSDEELLEELTKGKQE